MTDKRNSTIETPENESTESQADASTDAATGPGDAQAVASEEKAPASADSEAARKQKMGAVEGESAEADDSLQQSATADKNEKSSAPGPRKRRAYLPWVLFLLVIGVLAFGLVAGTSYLRATEQRIEGQSRQLQSVEEQLTNQQRLAAKRLADMDSAHRRQIEVMEQQLAENQDLLADLGQRMAAQSKRLLAMSDTSREDWLLAEAEYLLKLANQRVRIERSPAGADALLDEADAILRDMEDPDLHALRRAIARDLAALRLLEVIDVEGIYLALVALAEQVDKLPTRPERREGLASADNQTAAGSALGDDNEQADSWWDTVKASFTRFVSTFNSFYRITYHREAPKQLLPPEQALYLQQNLRLMLERAQLALLREQQDIYTQSLDQSLNWVRDHYFETPEALNFRAELAKLREKTVVQSLPDISPSLTLINEYIRNLHSLKGTGISPAEINREEVRDEREQP